MKRLITILQCAVSLICFFIYDNATAQITQFPYSTGFEDDAELTDWNFADGDFNYWIIGDAVSYEGNRCLYVTPDDYSHEYYGNMQAASHYYVTITIPENGMYVDFDYLVDGIEGEARFMIGLLPSGSTPQPNYGNVDYDNAYLKSYCCTSGWVHERLFISPSYAGSKVLLFTWQNDGQAEVGLPAAIDNLRLTALNCSTPSAAVIDQTTEYSVDFHWQQESEVSEYLAAYSASPYTAWTEVSAGSGSSFSLNTLTPGTSYQLKMRAICSGTDTTQYTVEVPFATPYPCSAPANSQILQVTDNSILIVWDRVSGDNTYYIAYTNGGSSFGTESTQDSSYTLAGLLPGNSYSIRLYRYCTSMASYSDSISMTVSTTCDQYSEALPFSESFEGTIFPPACWQYVELTASGNSVQWEMSSAFSAEGNQSASFKAHDLPAGDAALLITPKLDLPSGNVKKIRFSMYRYDEQMVTDIEGVRIWLNQTPDTIQAVELLYIPRNTLFDPYEDEEGWYEYSTELPEIPYSQAFILFEGISEYGSNLYIDDIAVYESPMVSVLRQDTICSGTSYPFYGRELTESGRYIDTVPGVAMNDTIVTLLLAVVDGDNITLRDTICLGDSYSVGDSVYTTTGTHITSLENSMGCDSIVTLHLVVETVLEAPVIQRSDEGGKIILKANAENGIQWYRDQIAMDGDTLPQLEASIIGEYHARLQNRCGESSPSNSIIVQEVGLTPFDANSTISIYPNPTRGMAYLISEQIIDQVVLYNLAGQKLYSSSEHSQNISIDLSSFSEGIYIIQIMSGGKTKNAKINVIR